SSVCFSSSVIPEVLSGWATSALQPEPLPLGLAVVVGGAVAGAGAASAGAGLGSSALAAVAISNMPADVRPHQPALSILLIPPFILPDGPQMRPLPATR